MRYVEIDARNAFIPPFEEYFLQQLMERAVNDKVKRYIKSNIRKWLINEYEPVKPIKLQDLSNSLFLRGQKAPDWLVQGVEKGDTIYAIRIHVHDKEILLHYIDYLNTLHGDISRIPVKELPRLVKEWEKTFTESSEKEDGIEIIYKYNDGFSWVKVFGKDSLNREGKLMNHCVGGYYNQVKENKCEIYSLRDKNNKPHITIEYRKETHTLYQIKGNSNKPPKEIYIDYLIHFINKILKPHSCVESDLIRVGFIFLNKKLYRIQDAPKGTEIEFLELLKNIDISHLNINKIIIPKNYSSLILPKNLKCNKLEIHASNIKINTGTHVKSLILYATIQTLPDDIQIDKELLAMENNDFPYNINIKGFIHGDFNNITPTSIDEVEEDKNYLEVQITNGQVTLPRCHIEQLFCFPGTEVTVPENTKIKRIGLTNCKLHLMTNVFYIEQLDFRPISINGKEKLYIQKCQINNLNENCKLPEKWEINNLEYYDRKRKIPSSWKIHNLTIDCTINEKKQKIKVYNDCEIRGDNFLSVIANNCKIFADSYISNIKCNNLIIIPLWETNNNIEIEHVEANNIYLFSEVQHKYSSVIFKDVICDSIYSNSPIQSNRKIMIDYNMKYPRLKV